MKSIIWNCLQHTYINVWKQIYIMFDKLFPYWEWLTIYGKLWLSDFTLTRETFTNNYYKIATVPFKSKLTLDSRSSHESRIEPLFWMTTSRLLMFASQFLYSIPARLAKPEWLLFEFRVINSWLSILEFLNGLCESLNTIHLFYCCDNRPL